MTNFAQESAQAQALRQQFGEMVRPLDKRLMATFFATLQAIFVHRHNLCGLLLSELGGYLLSPAQAPAGTKRLTNLLRSRRWETTVIARFLWRQGAQTIAYLAQAGEQAFALWDKSVLEKAERLALEGVCPVHPGRAARLKRIKRGSTSRPVARPISSLGALVVSGGLRLIGYSGVGEIAVVDEPGQPRQ
jgi:hypothetical protein